MPRLAMFYSRPTASNQIQGPTSVTFKLQSDQNIATRGKHGMAELEMVKYRPFKLFALSVLWRTAATDHQFFKNIDIGIHKEELRKMVRSSEPGPPWKYPVQILGFLEEPPKTFPPPLVGQMDQFGPFPPLWCQIFLGRWLLVIHLYKNAPEIPFRLLDVRPELPSVAMFMHWSESAQDVYSRKAMAYVAHHLAVGTRTKRARAAGGAS